MALLADVRPTRRVYLGLLADPYDALSTVAWTEITKVQASTLRWGAQHELGRVEPSYVALTLDNRDGEFEPLNPASPHYPYLRPLNRLRIVDTWAGVDYIRFTGYVADWPRSWTGIGSAVVQVQAYDSLGAVLNSIDIPGWPWELEIRNMIEDVPAAGKAVWLRLNETNGTVANDSSGYGLNGQYQGSPTLGVDGLTPDGDKAVEFPALSRVSLPYKNLISGYPWSLHCKFRCSASTADARMIFAAYDGPTSSFRQLVQIFIQGSPAAEAGKIIALVANPYPTGTQSFSTITVNDDGEHRLAVVAASSTSLKIYIDGVDRTSAVVVGAHSFPNDLITGYAVGNNPAATFGDWNFTLASGDVLDEVLVLDGLALSATQVARLNNAGGLYTSISALSGFRLSMLLDALGWPSADRDIDNGLTTVQQGYVAGKALTYMQRLDITEGGRLFQAANGEITFHDRHRILQPPYTVSQATFGEGTGEIGYVGPFNHGEDDQDIYNDVPVGNVGGHLQVARDKTSKDRYGWKTLTGLTDLLGVDDNEARDRANHDLAIYKDPVTRIRSITVKPQEDAAQGTAVWPALLGLGQNSRVTVKAQPPGAPLITQESHVEHFDETVTPTDWQITLGLSAAQTVEFWTLGSSAVGTGTRLSY